MREPENLLFVVYRTEWWGCLDSLCRQACEDANVQCYVMPVPYYDRVGENREMDMARKHFCPEALKDRLPQRAKLLDYQRFSEEQHFDKIYIHNPYDNANPADSVDAEFYSWNLKKKATELIYVPHLLYLWGIPEQYVHCSVYDYVDVILLPAERARYSLEVKYDAKVRIEPSGIPEYLERLEKSATGRGTAEGMDEKRQDSGSNPVRRLLYCVSFADLFYGTEKQLQKMRQLFDYLGDREDIQLIFRPDEDIPYRYSSLQTEIRQGYEKLLAYFKEKRIGTLDESPDLYQAAVDADGILSTGHPLDVLFGVQGKYTLHIDRELRPIPSEEDLCIPSLWATTVIEKKEELELWFVPGRTRLLCRMTIPGGQVEVVDEVPDEVDGWLNYVGIEQVGDYLYLIPYVSDGIWKYDLKTGSFCKRYLPTFQGNYMTKVIPYGKDLYFIPRAFPGIVKYHTENDTYDILDGWVEELDALVSSECKKEPYFIWAVKQEENHLYMASSKCDAWVEWNLEDDSWRVMSMNLPGRRFADMVKEGDSVWLLPYCGDDIVEWNRARRESRVLCTEKSKEARNVPYAFMLDMDNQIAVFPQKAENSLRISKKNAQELVKLISGLPCKKEEYLSEYLKQQKIGYQFAKQLHNGRILAYEFYDGAFLLLDQEMQLLQKIPCRLPIESVRQTQELTWKREQLRYGFCGYLHEGYTIPAMVDFFVESGLSYREELKEYLKRFM